MNWKIILLLLVLFPIAAYLREATYKWVHGRNIIAEDLRELWRILKGWRQKRKQRKAEKKKFG